MQPQDSVARWTAVASLVVAIVGGLGNFFWAKVQADQTARSLAIAEQELESVKDQGPKLKVQKAELYVYKPESKAWLRLDQQKNVTAADDEAGNIVLVLTVVNEGRFQATISKLGMGTDENTYVPASLVNCEDTAGSESVGECKMPTVLAPQTEKKFYIDLDRPDMRKALTCNKYIESGLEHVISPIGAPHLVGRMPKSIYYATDCP